MYIIEKYKEKEGHIFRVLVIQIQSPDQVLTDGEGSIHQALIAENLAQSTGLYFYRFAILENPQAFSKIGEVSKGDTISMRQKRGWLSPAHDFDSYLNKGVHADILATTEANPMYFVFYEFDVLKSFPKIDMMATFEKHHKRFGRSTKTSEQNTAFNKLGLSMIWYDLAFNEVLEMKFPSGKCYSDIDSR
jgi:hypothetical protein